MKPTNTSASLGARQAQVLRLSVCALLAVAAISGTAYRLVVLNRCAMDQSLLELLLYSTDKLESAGVPYWLEFGTLLGAVRDKAIVPWEFDVDVAVTEQYCDQVLSLRDTFAREKGYKMYGRGEFIPEKASLFGLIGGTISAPCVRVYSRDGTLPMDIYWVKQLTLTPDHTAPNGQRYIPPPDHSGDLNTVESESAAVAAGVNSESEAVTDAAAAAADPSAQILCDHEAFTTDIGDHSSPCRWYSDVFPLTTTTMYGRAFPVPHRPRKILTQTYGPNWMTPKPKGYKALLCPPVWHTGSGSTYAVACAGALAVALALFVYLRASYALTISASAAATAGAAGSGTNGAADGSADPPGCCDRAFQRVYRWTGVGGASASATGADAERDRLFDADQSDPDRKRLHAV